MALVKNLKEVGSKQNDVAQSLLSDMNNRISSVGLVLRNLQVMSLLPTKDMIEALDAKAAMEVLGNPRDFLLFKAAKSLTPGSNAGSAGNDPMHMMMGLVLGNKLMAPENTREPQPITAGTSLNCPHCSKTVAAENRYCGHCGKEVKL